MEWRPNRIVAVMLALLVQPLAMFYLARAKWAIAYLLVPLVIMGAEFAFSAPWLRHFSLGMIVAIVCAIHAYWIATRGKTITNRPWFSRWYGLAGLYIVFFATVFSVRAFFYEPFRMPSGSMLPTIPIGAHLIVEKYGYGNYGTFGISFTDGEMTSRIARGDLIVFDYPEDPSVQYIKRVIGLPGDTLVFSDRQVVINGIPVATEVVTGEIGSPGEDVARYLYKRESLSDTAYTVAYIEDVLQGGFEVTVPARSYFVLGDNRDNSRDSRFWGFVPQQNIVGKVIYISR